MNGLDISLYFNEIFNFLVPVKLFYVPHSAPYVSCMVTCATYASYMIVGYSVTSFI